MKIKKFIKAMLYALVLITSTIFVLNTQEVEAKTRINLRYWSQPHHVVTTKPVYATAMVTNFKIYKDVPIKKKLIPVGTPLYILYGGEIDGTKCWGFMSYVPVKGIGKPYKNKYYWCIPNLNRNWFRIGYVKPIMRKNYFSNQNGELRFSSIKVFPDKENTLNNNNENDKTGCTILLRLKFKNKGKSITPFDYFENNINLYGIFHGKKKHIPINSLDSLSGNNHLRYLLRSHYEIERGHSAIFEVITLLNDYPTTLIFKGHGKTGSFKYPVKRLITVDN